MIDLRETVAPKSDQLNADDLIGRTLDVTVTDVGRGGSPEQPIAISFEGDNGKPYYPCKSMRRVLINVWGADGKQYIGRRMRLYRDDGVLFGGVKVGGIRISHVSDIDGDVTMALTATKASRKPFTVKPMPAAPKLVVSKPKITPEQYADGIIDLIRNCQDRSQIDAVILAPARAKGLASLAEKHPDQMNRVSDAISEVEAGFAPAPAEIVPATDEEFVS